MKQRGKMPAGAAEELAIQALSYIAGDEERLERFLIRTADPRTNKLDYFRSRDGARHLLTRRKPKYPNIGVLPGLNKRAR